MTSYLLSTFSDSDTTTDEAAEPPSPPSPEQMQEMMSTIIALEAEMDEGGTFVFGGHLHGPDATTVVDQRSGAALITDGPFVEAKEHIAGFYVIQAADLDEAMGWAGRVSACVGRPIEVRPFGGTGRAADQMPPAG